MKTIAAALAAAALLTGSAYAGQSQDPYRANQWGLDLIGVTDDLPKGKGVIVAVVDTGLDVTHPDLKGRAITPPGSDLFKGGNERARRDPNGHGTHVAGVIAASAGNGVGVEGIAPAARILPVR